MVIIWIGLLRLSGCYCEDALPEYLPLAPGSEMASKADFYNCDNRQLRAQFISCSNHPWERLSSFPSELGNHNAGAAFWHACASAGASQMGTHTSEQDISRHVM